MYTMFTLREFPFFVRLISHATLTSTETRCLHLPHEVKLLDLTPRDLVAKGLTFRKTYRTNIQGWLSIVQGFM